MLFHKRTALVLFGVGVIGLGNSRAQEVRRFDFGTGQVASGYTQVRATDTYSDGKGFGFDYRSSPIAINRGSVNGNESPLTSDFCTGIGSVFFSTRLPQGNYQVTVTVGDAIKATTTTIKAESRRLMAERVETEPGEFKTISFNVAVYDSIIHPGRMVKLKPREVDKLDWDNKLTLEFSNINPSVNAIVIKPVKNPIQVFLMGNSTVTNQSLEPWACWGQMIPAFFSSNRIVVTNMAASGETLRSSLGRRRLEKVASMLHKGDYVFIEFAHNDQKKGSGEQAYTTYNDYLRIYADTVRNHGAIPVFVTSTHRRNFDKSGHVINTLGDFPDAMRLEAKKEHIALIDLNAMTKTLYEAFGKHKSRTLFVQYPAGTFVGQDKELADNTHFCDFGAYELAKCMVEGIRRSDLALKNYLKKDLPVFDLNHPDDRDYWDFPFTPMFSSIKPYGN